LTTKLFQRKDEAGVDSFRIEAMVSFSTTDALIHGLQTMRGTCLQERLTQKLRRKV
jgi:hypothetical protein